MHWQGNRSTLYEVEVVDGDGGAGDDKARSSMRA